jgi:hypothetical protein
MTDTEAKGMTRKDAIKLGLQCVENSKSSEFVYRTRKLFALQAAAYFQLAQTIEPNLEETGERVAKMLEAALPGPKAMLDAVLSKPKAQGAKKPKCSLCMGTGWRPAQTESLSLVNSVRMSPCACPAGDFPRKWMEEQRAKS